jgi:hypothetical protein
VASKQLVVWQADGLDGSLFGIYGALVGPQGEVEGPFKINHYTARRVVELQPGR